jgi:hypothetical protein
MTPSKAVPGLPKRRELWAVLRDRAVGHVFLESEQEGCEMKRRTALRYSVYRLTNPALTRRSPVSSDVRGAPIAFFEDQHRAMDYAYDRSAAEYLSGTFAIYVLYDAWSPRVVFFT